MLCMSSDSTLKLIYTMGFSHDAAVFQWRDHLHNRLEKSVPEVSQLHLLAHHSLLNVSTFYTEYGHTGQARLFL